MINIGNLVSEHAPALLSSLTESGFSTQQAEGFLPAVIEQVVAMFNEGGASELLGEGDSASLAANLGDRIDVDALASGAGLDPAMARKGVDTLLPQMIGLLKDQSGGLSSLISDPGAGAVAGLAGKLFGR